MVVIIIGNRVFGPYAGSIEAERALEKLGYESEFRRGDVNHWRHKKSRTFADVKWLTEVDRLNLAELH